MTKLLLNNTIKVESWTYLKDLNTCDGLCDNERLSDSGNVLKIWNEVTTILNFGMTISKDKEENIRTMLVIILVVSSDSSLTPGLEDVDAAAAVIGRYDKMLLSFFAKIIPHAQINKKNGMSTSVAIWLGPFSRHV